MRFGCGCALFKRQLHADAAADIAAFGGADGTSKPQRFAAAEDVLIENADGRNTPGIAAVEGTLVASDAEHSIARQHWIGQCNGECDAVECALGIFLGVVEPRPKLRDAV